MHNNNKLVQLPHRRGLLLISASASLLFTGARCLELTPNMTVLTQMMRVLAVAGGPIFANWFK